MFLHTRGFSKHVSLQSADGKDPVIVILVVPLSYRVLLNPHGLNCYDSPPPWDIHLVSYAAYFNQACSLLLLTALSSKTSCWFLPGLLIYLKDSVGTSAKFQSFRCSEGD